jgi:hypothetical protein
MLTPWHYIAIGAPLLLLLLKGGSRFSMALLFVALLLSASEAVIDVRIRAIRNESAQPISSLRRDDPVRRRFGLLHGVSSLLLLGQVVIAAVVVARNNG